MSSEMKAMGEERRRNEEMKAFSEARESIEARAKEVATETDAQLAELRKKAVEGFKDL